MEDDNATDVIKWLFNENTKVDLTEDVQMRHDDQLIPCTVCI